MARPVMVCFPVLLLGMISIVRSQPSEGRASALASFWSVAFLISGWYLVMVIHLHLSMSSRHVFRQYCPKCCGAGSTRRWHQLVPKEQALSRGRSRSRRKNMVSKAEM
ncbi:hypothetical protein BZA05DRAFT_384295 [Tricharina praecox]|uniref:uncharacterized protein n=1 Tax=Tricharina praecox TaxID=43433 RepID=UPI0022206D76|nr:uncharacterized protein BZA05DRAFT_384295 [Tricharina praecox]KAI5857664.1 hypothetical protein BZA05DRAFT_384295 [Tricharina praecox]